MNPTRIDWADATWNPVWGCTFGCPYCYARGTAKRWGNQIAGRSDFVPTWIEQNFNRVFPSKPSRIFVNSMSDIADWKPEWMEKVIARIADAPQHSFLFLTKRPSAYASAAMFRPKRNAWLGVSATNGMAPRTPREGSGIRFVSIEPLLGPIEHLDPMYAWVIIGAESGNRADKIIPKREWVDAIVADCREKGIAIFMKSSLTPIMGEDLIREFPTDGTK